jgi:hypothetical protein
LEALDIVLRSVGGENETEEIDEEEMYVPQHIESGHCVRTVVGRHISLQVEDGSAWWHFLFHVALQPFTITQ